MITFIGKWLTKRAEEAEAKCMNDPIYSLLRREVTRVGQSFEKKPIEYLLKPDDEMSFVETIDGIEIFFNCCFVDQKSNGDVLYCIDASAESNKTGRQPSYQFHKKPSGEVYY